MDMMDEERFINEAAENSVVLAEHGTSLRALSSFASRQEVVRALESLCEALLAVISRFIRADVRAARLRRDLQTLNQRTIDYTPTQTDPYRGSSRMREIHSELEVQARDTFRVNERLDNMSEQIQAVVIALEAAGIM